MTLLEYWEEHWKQFQIKYPKVRPTAFMVARIKEAFYAGAEAERHEEIQSELSRNKQ